MNGSHVAKYGREDFNENANGDAFLVRMRRSNESLDPNVGESGGTIPYLFGRGFLLDPVALRQGLTVRAVSIAEARPAVRVGRPVASGAMPGAIPVAIASGLWESLGRNTPVSVADFSDEEYFALDPAVQMIGAEIESSLAASPGEQTGYAVVFAAIPTSNQGGSTQQRAIGFGWVRIEPLASGDTGTAMMITKLVDPDTPTEAGSIAPGNATARLSEAWSSLGELNEFERSEVIELNRGTEDLLQAPLLVR